jgi:hypothetical protein
MIPHYTRTPLSELPGLGNADDWMPHEGYGRADQVPDMGLELDRYLFIEQQFAPEGSLGLTSLDRSGPLAEIIPALVEADGPSALNGTGASGLFLAAADAPAFLTARAVQPQSVGAF